MEKYNYKCVVSNKGSKRYYKSVGGKWKRVSNAVGMKAEKGKRKYANGGDKSEEDKPECSVCLRECDPKKDRNCGNPIKRHYLHCECLDKFEDSYWAVSYTHLPLPTKA